VDNVEVALRRDTARHITLKLERRTRK
jgi:Fe2+ transport system protein FeoA